MIERAERRQGVETPGDGAGRSPLVSHLGDSPAGRRSASYFRRLAPLVAANETRAARTRCKYGHELAVISGQKRCRVCHADASRRYRAREKVMHLSGRARFSVQGRRARAATFQPIRPAAHDSPPHSSCPTPAGARRAAY